MPAKSLGNIDSNTASVLITAASDVALVLMPGEGGVIRDIAFGDEGLAQELQGRLRGKTWAETVTTESRPKVEALLADAANKSPPKWRQVNHPVAEGIDLPIMYAAVQLTHENGIIAVGRSMRPMARLQQQLVEAQQTMDREYLRLRQAETRHRLLFQLSSEAVLIVDAQTNKVVDANPVALRLLGDAQKRLVGRGFLDGFDAASRQAVESLLGTVRTTGRGRDVPARSAFDAERNFFVSASLFREGRSSFFMVRLVSAAAEGFGAGATSRVLEVVEGSPDGFVLTDLKGRVTFANRAFLDAAQLPTLEQAQDQPLERWLGRPGVDFNLLTTQLREHGSVRRFATALRGSLGADIDVEICAVAVPDGDEPCFGFTLREVLPRVQEKQKVAETPRSVQQLTELVGRVPLKDLVRESTDMIEKLCIESALQLSGDNRVSAAEMLGLSRQSLYAKLRRYGLGDLEPNGDDLPEAEARE